VSEGAMRPFVCESTLWRKNSRLWPTSTISCSGCFVTWKSSPVTTVTIWGGISRPTTGPVISQRRALFWGASEIHVEGALDSAVMGPSGTPRSSCSASVAGPVDSQVGPFCRVQKLQRRQANAGLPDGRDPVPEVGRVPGHRRPDPTCWSDSNCWLAARMGHSDFGISCLSGSIGINSGATCCLDSESAFLPSPRPFLTFKTKALSFCLALLGLLVVAR
jgi:hypothetical protein